MNARQFLADLWRWRGGRQATGYEKCLLLALPWPIPCDLYLLRFRAGTVVPPHRDRVERGRHYRLNLILRAARRGGEFVCARPIYVSRRIKFFRPDLETHEVTRIEEGTRYVLSLGWVLGARGVGPAA